ncbi:MAG: hypothetical protein HDS83_00095 [Bacteroidales bacterium]|nr:hypothetical protein [Bacteroidales bacterium]
MKIEKTFGISGVADSQTLIRLQELIALAKQQYGWVGKAIIDPEKITYYKFGLKLGISPLAANGLLVNEVGIIRDYSIEIPQIINSEILTDLCIIFNFKIF